MSRIEMKRQPGFENDKSSHVNNTLILLDGKPIECLQDFKFDFTTEAILPVITLKIIPTELKIDFDFNLDALTIKDVEEFKERENEK